MGYASPAYESCEQSIRGKSVATVRSAPSPTESHVAKRRPRFIIATPICDGHDVAAAAITRLLRREGVEAVYIGFNKSVHDIVKAAVEEDASAIALSTYNGGHMSFIRELLKEQRRQGIGHVPLFCGGGGTILAREVAPLERMGVAKVYRPPLELGEAISDMVRRTQAAAGLERPSVNGMPSVALARRLTEIELGHGGADGVGPSDPDQMPTVWGINGRGGAGKSTLIDELVYRFLESSDGAIAVLTLDPTLGDRLRMLYCYSPRVYLRSVRLGPGDPAEETLPRLIDALRAAEFSLILVESVGLGQNDLGVAPYVDRTVFCLTPDYGTDVQLEKEALLPRADVVVMNKRDYPQAEARGRRVQNLLQERQAFVLTEAKEHRDPGVSRLFEVIAARSGPASPVEGRRRLYRASSGARSRLPQDLPRCSGGRPRGLLS